MTVDRCNSWRVNVYLPWVNEQRCLCLRLRDNARETYKFAIYVRLSRPIKNIFSQANKIILDARANPNCSSSYGVTIINYYRVGKVVKSFGNGAIHIPGFLVRFPLVTKIILKLVTSAVTGSFGTHWFWIRAVLAHRIKINLLCTHCSFKQLHLPCFILTEKVYCLFIQIVFSLL